MANLSIRRIDDETLARLHIRAAEQGVSVEEEVRRILKQAVEVAAHLADLALSLFGEAHGVELELPTRAPHAPLDLGE